MTSTGSFCYMPPEVFMNEPYSFKVDVYSFAMVMYELFECKMPYEEELKVWSFEELGTMACKGVRPYMRRSPMSVRQLISKMWETDPDKRPDFHAIVESLHNIKSSDEFQESAEVPAKTSCCTIS